MSDFIEQIYREPVRIIYSLPGTTAVTPDEIIHMEKPEDGERFDVRAPWRDLAASKTGVEVIEGLICTWIAPYVLDDVDTRSKIADDLMGGRFSIAFLAGRGEWGTDDWHVVGRVWPLVELVYLDMTSQNGECSTWLLKFRPNSASINL